MHWVRQPQGLRQQLTFAEDPVLNAWPVVGTAQPQALFLRDHAGNEAFQLFHLDLPSQTLTQLSAPPSRQGVVIPATQAGLFAFYSTARNQRDWDLMRLSLAALDANDAPTEVAQSTQPAGRLGDSPLITSLQQSEGIWLPLDWSPDAQWLLATEVRSGAVSLPYLLRTDGSGERIPLFRQDEQVAYMDGRFSKDGQGIYFLSNRAREFVGLFYLDLRSGELSLLLDLPYDIESLAQSPDRQTLALVVNEDGYSRLRLFRLPDFTPIPSAAIPAGVMDQPRFSADSRWLGFSLTTPQHPRDVFAVEIASGHLERWTRSELGGLDEAAMFTPKLIHFPSPALVASEASPIASPELEVPAWYYPPPRTVRLSGDESIDLAKSPAAVVVLIHGGPEVQARPRFDPLIQFWQQELGVAVIVPNVRGSQGYGSTYLSLDDGRRREHAVADIGALLDWIEQQPELDASRVGLYGASYGGYMVLAAMAAYGERVRAGVDLNGISDFVTFLRQTSEYRRQHRRAEYGDERRRGMRQFLRSISPLHRSEEILSPLLIAQGENDPRVPVKQSEQMVAALRRFGREVWYLLAQDEGHGFRKQSNRLQLQQTVAWFWCRHLLDSCAGMTQTAQGRLESPKSVSLVWPPDIVAESWGMLAPPGTPWMPQPWMPQG